MKVEPVRASIRKIKNFNNIYIFSVVEEAQDFVGNTSNIPFPEAKL